MGITLLMSSDQDFAVTEERARAAELELRVRGELDLSTLPDLRVPLEQAGTDGVRRILVDLSGVTFIDSVSLAALVAAQRRLPDDGRLAVVASHPYVLLIFEAGGLDSVLDVFRTREAAEAHLRD